MNVKVEAVDQHKVSVAIEVPAEVVQKGFRQAVSRIANQVRIPGFRKGKANRKILEMHFGKEAVAGEARDIVINDALNQALTEQKLVPVTSPEVKEDKFSETEGAAFTATFVKEPEVTLGEYKGLEAVHTHPEISDDMVMGQLQQAAAANARLEKAEDGAVLKKGDYAIIDFKGTVDGEAFEGGEGKTYPLEIGSQSFIPGFEDQLEGHKAGDDVTVKVKFPESYFVKELAGKDAEFAVHINDVKRKVLPPLDDTFAKSVSQYETLEDLKNSLKERMQLQAFQQAEEAFHQALIGQAVNNAKVDIPQEMVDQRVDEIVEQIKLNLEAQEQDFGSYLKAVGKTEEEFRKDYEKTAEAEVREGLVLTAIANEENLDVSNQDLNMEIYSMARQFNAEPKDVVKILRDEGRVGMLYNSVRRKKAAAFIYGAAKKAEADKAAAEEVKEEVKVAEVKAEEAKAEDVKAEAKEEKPAAKKPAAKKIAAKKPAAKKTTAKKTAAKAADAKEEKPAAKKPAVKKTTAKKTTAKKTAAKKAEEKPAEE